MRVEGGKAGGSRKEVNDDRQRFEEAARGAGNAGKEMGASNAVDAELVSQIGGLERAPCRGLCTGGQ